MSKIEKIDKNFVVGSTIDKEGIAFHNVLSEPFKIYGVQLWDGQLRRMPASVAEQVSEGVSMLHRRTAGGRIRFKTNSSSIAISAKLADFGMMPHIAFCGAVGFDMYEEKNGETFYVKTFIPPVATKEEFESLFDYGEKRMRELTINMPTYASVTELYIGLDEDAIIEAPRSYTYEKPFVTYGSSITQGGCASRPGMAYQAMLTRRFDIDHINLGFSGNARAEDVMIDYVAGLDMSFFIYDYDHNAPTLEHYEKTHEKMFKAVRAAHPDIPILILTRPKYYLNKWEVERREVAHKTYENALAAGDKHVWFMDGPQLMALCKDEGTVDNTHPTDVGFFSMAQAIGGWMEENHILDMIEKA